VPTTKSTPFVVSEDVQNLNSALISPKACVSSGLGEVLGNSSLMALTMVGISLVVKGRVFCRFLAGWMAGLEDFLFQVDVLAVESAAFLREVEAVLAVGSAGFVQDVSRVTTQVDFFAGHLS